MASDAFGVGLEPFGISPDPRFIYFDSKLRQEHQVLLDGLRKGTGLTVISGEHGVGKTMLLNCLAAELDVADHLVVYISCIGAPSIDEILDSFAVQIGFPGYFEETGGENIQNSLAGMLGSIGVCGTTAILLLDDADRLAVETLSALSAMCRGDSKQGEAISIVLAGLPDLAARLEAARNRFPERRLDLNVSMTPLQPREAESYVYHRLHMAGYGGNQVFTPEAIARVAHHAQGNPQAINRICRAAMVIASMQSEKTVSVGMVDQVAPSGGGGRTPQTARAMHQHRSPHPSEGMETIQDIVVSADARRQETPSRPRAAGPAFTPGDSGRARAGTPEDDTLDEVPGGSIEGFGSAMPSGRDLTAQVAAETEDAPRGGARPLRWKRWAALGAMSAVAAVALYLFASGDMNDSVVGSKESPAIGNAQISDENPSSPNSLGAEATARDMPPDSGSEMPASPPSWGSPLEKAVFLGDIRAVAALLDEGADINAPGADGGTLLVVAANNGDEAMVSYLIHRGADPSFGAIDGADLGSGGLFSDLDGNEEALLREPGSLESAGPEREFSTAAGTEVAVLGDGPRETSRDKLSRELLLSTAGDGGERVNRPTPSPTSPPAATAGSEKQADLEGSPNMGVTPLIAAARAGHADVVGVLLAAGAKVNVADTRGRTPLMAAVDAGDEESARLLLARDADVHAVDGAGRTALDIARQQSRWDLVGMISTRAERLPMETTTARLSPDAGRAAPEAEKPATTDQPQPKPGRPVETTATRLSPDAEKPAAKAQPQPKTSRPVELGTPSETPDRARVTQAQKYLRQLGYNPGPVDGVGGAKTSAAVRRFQSDRGLNVDGEVTASLLMALATESGAREARQMMADNPTRAAGSTKAARPTSAEPAPKVESFFHEMLSELQKLRGLEFNSNENPEAISQYCKKNTDNWIYDKGVEKTVYCRDYLRSKEYSASGS